MPSKEPSAKLPDEQVLGAIPARWQSSRFPGKPLHLIGGKPLVQHVWDQCQQCQHLDRVVIATDDDRIRDAAHAFGAEVFMTAPDHPSGTDRIAEVATGIPEASVILNIQGDEPLIDPGLIDELALELRNQPDLEMVTAANPIEDEALLGDPNVVKVVLNQKRDALYFSRSCIPFRRTQHVTDLSFYRHKGIYGFRRDFLLQYVDWDPSPLEESEQLEQLRALHHGARIRVVITDDESPGIDTPEQARILHLQLTAG